MLTEETEQNARLFSVPLAEVIMRNVPLMEPIGGRSFRTIFVLLFFQYLSIFLTTLPSFPGI